MIMRNSMSASTKDDVLIISTTHPLPPPPPSPISVKVEGADVSAVNSSNIAPAITIKGVTAYSASWFLF